MSIERFSIRVSRSRFFVIVFAALLNASFARAASHYVEEFDTSTFKNASNTTAFWNTAAGKLQLYPFQYSSVGSYDTPGIAQGVAIFGGLVLVADGLSGVRILGLSPAPANPADYGAYDTPGTAYGVTFAWPRVYVADGTSGLVILDLTNPQNPVLLGSYNTPGTAYGVTVVGSVAYVADGVSGLLMINVANPASPILLGTFNTPGSAQGVVISGNLAYVADGVSGLQIINVSNPAVPTLAGSYDTPGSAAGVAVSGTQAYIADTGSGLRIVNVSNPASPTLAGFYDTPGNALGVAVSVGTAYVADEGSGLQIIDVVTPSVPALLGTVDTPGNALGVAIGSLDAAYDHMALVADGSGGLRAVGAGTWEPVPLGSSAGGTGVALGGTRAYLTDGFAGLRIVDVTNPAAPAVLGTYDTPGNASSVAVSGSVAYVADGLTLQIINVSNPASPTLLGMYDTPGTALGVAVSGTRAYVADGASGLVILDVNNPAAPTLLGSYNTTGSANGVAVSGTMAYVADGLSGLQVIDVANSASPLLRGTYNSPGSAYAVAISDTVACLADGGEVTFIGVSNPASPYRIAAYFPPSEARNVAVSGSVVYVACENNGLGIATIAYLPAVIVLGTYDTQGTARGVVVSGRTVYLADGQLRVFEVPQRRFDTIHSIAESLPIDGESEDIRRVRILSPLPADVSLQVSAGGGFQPASVGEWVVLTTTGPDLTWEAFLELLTPGGPELSRLEIEWLFLSGVIQAVADVPNDQGGRVRLTLMKSGFDFAGEVLPVTGYQIYHRVDDATLASRVRGEGEVAGSGLRAALTPFQSSVRVLKDRTFVLGDQQATAAFPPGTWEVVGWIAARQADSYVTLAPTTGDSTASGIDWSVFLVTTHTTDPLTWYVSRADSGYSVDNLAPSVPTGFVASWQGATELSWNAPVDADFRYFRVYRSGDPGFTPGLANLVHSTTSTSWTDAAPGNSAVYYKLTATDVAGNESGPASTAGIVGADNVVPPRFALHAATPNPFRDAVTVRYDVPASGGDVSLAIYDVTGRRVYQLVSGPQAAGAKHAIWHGRDEGGARVAAGLYLARMRAPGFSEVRKFVLAR